MQRPQESVELRIHDSSLLSFGDLPIQMFRLLNLEAFAATKSSTSVY
jgi:hypothetical protein